MSTHVIFHRPTPTPPYPQVDDPEHLSVAGSNVVSRFWGKLFLVTIIYKVSST